MASAVVYQEILRQQKIDFALCDAAGRVYDYSPGLGALITNPFSGPLRGQHLDTLFDELAGAEAEIARLLQGELTSLKIEKVHHWFSDGRSGYLTLALLPFAPGLLLLAADVTAEGMLEQRVTQQRNELDLLLGQLNTARAQLDNLFHRLLPSAVATQALAHPQTVHLGGQTRVITAVFVDLRDYFVFPAAAPPEQVLARLSEYFSVLGDVIAAQGGTLISAAGDQVLALFNAPATQPDHVDRAAQTALGVQTALRQWNTAHAEGTDATLTPDYISGEFGIGLNTGPAEVGYLSVGARLDYTAVGETVHLAARLSGLSRTGQILVGPEAQVVLSQHQTLTRALGPTVIKGHPQPMPLYEVLAAAPTLTS